MQWQKFNRLQEEMVMGSTSLKIVVELSIHGQRVDGAICNSTPQAKAWVRRKMVEYTVRTPLDQLKFTVL